MQYGALGVCSIDFSLDLDTPAAVPIINPGHFYNPDLFDGTQGLHQGMGNIVEADFIAVCSPEFDTGMPFKITMPLTLDEPIFDTSIFVARSTSNAASPRSNTDPRYRYDKNNKIYHCAIPACNRSFKRRQELSRHHKSKHQRSEEYPCRVVGCGREKGFPRKDKRDDHERKVHGITRKQ